MDHQLEVNGMLDSTTLTAIQSVMQTLISDLNQANHPGLLLNRPLYDATTIAAVKLVQQRLTADGIGVGTSNGTRNRIKPVMFISRKFQHRKGIVKLSGK
ncbi:hypothetical protein [Chroococcidiopsis sp. CCMEE 29]|uniref:hypothetical protein n=1 Tax=Chroococcidiopsis sp. CCMEE 29 TaxID=155894 RepID=UPI00202154B8|nr:hypothetical protein [Chroococcidiopsis sp. CCMEE 29]